MRQLTHHSLLEQLIGLECVAVEAIRTNSLVKVALWHCIFDVINAKVLSLVAFIVALTDDHSISPFVWGFVDGFEVLLDVSVDIILVINDFVRVSGDLHDDGVRGLHSQHSLGCLVESLHVTAAKHLCETVNVLFLPEFVDEFQFLRLMHRLSS